MMTSEHKIIFLIGFMGCGKTLMASQLAEVSGLPFADMDEAIEHDYGMSIAAYFDAYGEASFREAERRMLLELIGYSYMIIATGGGTPCYPGNMDLMNRSGITVYLKRTPDELFEHLRGFTSERPLLRGMSDDALRAYVSAELQRREAFYLQAMYIVEGEYICAEHIYDLITHNVQTKIPSQ